MLNGQEEHTTHLCSRSQLYLSIIKKTMSFSLLSSQPPPPTIFVLTQADVHLAFSGDYRILLGDSGYAQLRYLFTPVLARRNRPLTEAEQKYNSSHRKTRVIVEQTIGLWKVQWGMLKDGIFRIKDDSEICNAIVVSAVLHNIAQRNGNFMEFDEPEPEDDNAAQGAAAAAAAPGGDITAYPETVNVDGQQARQEIIDSYF